MQEAAMRYCSGQLSVDETRNEDDDARHRCATDNSQNHDLSI